MGDSALRGVDAAVLPEESKLGPIVQFFYELVGVGVVFVGCGEGLAACIDDSL